MSEIKLLDCTLRDGGLGLEDAWNNSISKTAFTSDEIDRIICELNDSKIDIIELGAIECSNEDKTRFSIYQSITELSKKIPQRKNDEQMYVGLYRGPDISVDDIPEWNPALIEGVRVIIRYSELEKSMDFCAALVKKGYKVFVQPMLTMRYTDEEIQYIINETNRMGAYALYFVDSYGYMNEDDIERFVNIYKRGLKKNIKIGFHAHNNFNLAFSNALVFLKQESEHDLIIDACAIGMGQGAGNLQTEVIASYLNSNYKKNYNFLAILDVCEIVEKYLNYNLWGYSVARLLPALHKTAYKYAISMRMTYNMSYKQINEVLENMPEEIRHRYTPENLQILLNGIKK